MDIDILHGDYKGHKNKWQEHVSNLYYKRIISLLSQGFDFKSIFNIVSVWLRTLDLNPYTIHRQPSSLPLEGVIVKS